jgi:hypothetical protein
MLSPAVTSSHTYESNARGIESTKPRVVLMVDGQQHYLLELWLFAQH